MRNLPTNRSTCLMTGGDFARSGGGGGENGTQSTMTSGGFLKTAKMIDHEAAIASEESVLGVDSGSRGYEACKEELNSPNPRLKRIGRGAN